MTIPNEPEFTNNIVCPICGYRYQRGEDYQDLITLHGTEAGPHREYCPNCDSELAIEEYVERSWQVRIVKAKAVQ